MTPNERRLLDRCRSEIKNLQDKLEAKEDAGWEGVQRRVLLLSDLDKALAPRPQNDLLVAAKVAYEILQKRIPGIDQNPRGVMDLLGSAILEAES